MPSISPDKDGLLTVIHNVFTRTMEQYEETLTSLSEVLFYNTYGIVGQDVVAGGGHDQSEAHHHWQQ